jgi:hypothetical protein
MCAPPPVNALSFRLLSQACDDIVATFSTDLKGASHAGISESVATVIIPVLFSIE